MQYNDYIEEIEAIIAIHQRVQMANPPSSEKWQKASGEIHRLAALIVKAQQDNIAAPFYGILA